MSKVAVYSKAFLSIIQDFQAFLLSKCPELENEIKMSQMYVEMLQKVSLKNLIDNLYGVLKPYREEILNCNEAFFIDPSNIDSDIDVDKDLWHMLANCWRSEKITEMDQAQIWHYIHKMLKIGEILELNTS